MRRPTMTLAGTLVAAALLVPACGGGSGGPAAGGDGGSSRTGTGSTAPASSSSASPGDDDASPTAASSSKSAKPSESMPPARARQRCHTSQLSAGIQVRDSAAGHRHAAIVLTNTSDTACTIYGYGGMQLYNGDGGKVPTNLVRDDSHQPTTRLLAHGDKAYSAIRWSAVPHGNEPAGKRCEPKPAVAHVTPPDERDTITVTWTYGPVCGHGRIVQQPYVAKSSIKHPA